MMSVDVVVVVVVIVATINLGVIIRCGEGGGGILNKIREAPLGVFDGGIG